MSREEDTPGLVNQVDLHSKITVADGDEIFGSVNVGISEPGLGQDGDYCFHIFADEYAHRVIGGQVDASLVAVPVGTELRVDTLYRLGKSAAKDPGFGERGGEDGDRRKEIGSQSCRMIDFQAAG